ncbi:MAG: hypothetical protein U5N85_07765 [Arcicella sp.]|nr:hypothetical protein [Arcicella sp.]
MLKLALISLLLCLFSQEIFSQDYADTTKTAKNVPIVNIRLRDGTKLKGKILQNDGKNCLIQTDNLGTLNIPSMNIVATEQVSEVAVASTGEWIEPLRNTDYLLSSNGFNLPRGEWRYSNTYLYYNSFGVGITDNFSMNLAFIPIANIFTFSGKVSFEVSENLNFALNGNYITSSSRLVSIGVGTLGGVATFGKNNKNISIGATWGIGNGGTFTDKPIIQLSGIVRVSNKVALTMDNFLTTENQTTFNGQTTSSTSRVVGILTYGIRLLWSRSLLDVGLVSGLNNGSNSDVPFGFPYIKFTTSLSKKK